MRCLIGCFSNVLGLFLTFTFIFSVTFGIWMGTIWGMTFDRSTYNTIDDDIYEDMAILLIPSLADGMSQTKDSEEEAKKLQVMTYVATTLDNRDYADWEDIVLRNNLVDSEEIKAQVNKNLDTFFDYLDYNSDTFDVEFDLTPILVSLQNYSIADGVNATMQPPAWVICTPTQNDQFKSFVALESKSFPECLPDNETRLAFLQLIEESQALMIGTILALPTTPDGKRVVNIRYELYLEKLRQDKNLTSEEAYADTDKELADMRYVIGVTKNMIPLSFFFPLSLFGLLMIVRIHSAKDFFTWGGVSLTGAGILSLLFAVPWLFNLVNVSTNDFSNDFQLNDSTTDFFIEVERWYAGQIIQPILIVSAMVVILGFIGLVIGALMRGPSQNNEQPQIVYMLQQTPAPIGSSNAYAQMPPTPTPSSTPSMPFTPSKPSTPTPSKGSSSTPTNYELGSADEHTFVQDNSEIKE